MGDLVEKREILPGHKWYLRCRTALGASLPQTSDLADSLDPHPGVLTTRIPWPHIGTSEPLCLNSRTCWQRKGEKSQGTVGSRGSKDV